MVVPFGLLALDAPTVNVDTPILGPAKPRPPPIPQGQRRLAALAPPYASYTAG